MSLAIPIALQHDSEHLSAHKPTHHTIDAHSFFTLSHNICILCLVFSIFLLDSFIFVILGLYFNTCIEPPHRVILEKGSGTDSILADQTSSPWLAFKSFPELGPIICSLAAGAYKVDMKLHSHQYYAMIKYQSRTLGSMKVRSYHPLG